MILRIIIKIIIIVKIRRRIMRIKENNNEMKL